MIFFSRHLRLGICLLVGLSPLALAADCKTATVGSPYSTCFDIYTNAKITAAQFSTYNPGLNCSLLQIGQKVCISAGTLPSSSPVPSQNGTCAEYFVVPQDSCSAIGLKFHITVAQIESFNTKTYKWKGCAALQIGQVMCVSTGTPPPIPVNPLLQCGPESKGNATCPLKACCSAFGFCGITDEFCTTAAPNPCISNCFKPTLPSCSGFGAGRRNIAYYGGFGDRRNCNTNIAPNQIDWSPYTHAHFAFATISQAFKIQLEAADVPLLQQLVNAKKSVPGLKVVIALGGWDFSESQPTKDLFSVMISTSANRAVFISSVKAFLTQYTLDGIDVDFEYPAAIERSAPATDTPNLTSFFTELRTALPTQIISTATPAGYWFLRGFEIDKIASQVTYLNMMSYDYHGQWDTNITGQPPVTNPHTSILDMRDSALLYTRAGINLSKVNLGLAKYARTYKLANPSCAGYNCTMTGGGFPGLCTASSGILAQFEVESLLGNEFSPHLDSASQTYWFDDPNGSLITFDLADTWQAKEKFAGTSCFGGTFIWSLDQVIPEGGGSDGGDGSAVPIYSEVTWNPNPFPSPGAASETFVQSAGTFVTTAVTTVPVSTSTLTVSFVQGVWTETIIGSTVVSGTTKRTTATSVHPATTSFITTTRTSVSTVTKISTVVKTATTIIIPVPAQTTTITVEGFPITLNSGGTPVNAPVPTFITQPNAIKPNWTLNIFPPEGASTVTFTAPLTDRPTYSSEVPVPKTSDPPRTVTGPSGDHTRCDPHINIWNLLFGGVISGCLPIDVGIRGGITPKPIKPPGWTGPWIDPFPLPTGPPGGGGDPSDTNTQTSTTSSTTSSTSTSACRAQRTAPYSLSDDPENVDFVGHGTDPTYRRKRDVRSLAEPHRKQSVPAKPSAASFNATLLHHSKRFPQNPRSLAVQGCGPNANVTSPQFEQLTDGTYYTVGGEETGATTTNLISSEVLGRPGESTVQEHVFELGYIDQFLGQDPPMNAMDCNWIITNIFGYTRADGSNFGEALIAAIDTTQNMVWADKAMNQAKSNVVNRNKMDPNDPPQRNNLDKIIQPNFNFDVDINEELIYDVEYFLRNFAALGSYFHETRATFQSTAARVQQLLSEITPTAPPLSDASLPLIFNRWLEALVETYPSGCVSRATNAWEHYRSNIVAISAHLGGAVPACFTLFHRGVFNPSSFHYLDLVPAAPELPQCNVPGTTGHVGYYDDNSQPVLLDKLGLQRIMGSGNQDFYAMGSGTTISGAHWQAVHASQLGAADPSCKNVMILSDFVPQDPPPQPNIVTANVTLFCGDQVGRVNSLFNFVVNGQLLECALTTQGHPGGETQQLFCDADAAAAAACATSTQSSFNGLKHLFFFPA